jgi:hypothetical protein
MASKKKVAAKPQVWNKGLEVGKRDGLTPAQVKRIRGLLADRGVPGLRDLALFSTAVDTMLHGRFSQVYERNVRKDGTKEFAAASAGLVFCCASIWATVRGTRPDRS